MAKNKGGRPTKLSRELAKEMLDRMAAGESITKMCREDKTGRYPAKDTFFKWRLREGEDADWFRLQYALAWDARVESWADEISDISDGDEQDVIYGDDGKIHWNTQHINRSRLRIDTRKWLMSKMAKARYGEAQSLELTGANGGPIAIMPVDIPERPSREEWLERKRQEIEAVPKKLLNGTGG